jgi:hypothetical protein
MKTLHKKMITAQKQMLYIRCQFHQHFTRQIFVQTSFWQLFSSYMYIDKAAETTFVRKMLMKLTIVHIFVAVEFTVS